MSELPLRLAAEPIVRNIFGQSCFVLPSIEEDKVCYIVADEGLLGLAVSGSGEGVDSEGLRRIAGLLEVDMPVCLLVRQRGESGVSEQRSGFRWIIPGRGSESQSQQRVRKQDILQHVKPPSVDCAKRIIQSIERYYQRQVLEPSIRGFLAILEKQFPRNDLYLFELLQNAVDDGADTIVLKSLTGSNSTGDINDNTGLLFCHNGKAFSPLDVLGLASVGLSTKSTTDQKKIGFMGVGFKAVYKRFARVCVYDNVWRFAFEEPASTPPMEPSHSWVLKPTWLSHTSSFTQMQASADALTTAHTSAAEWCHFVLQRPRGGIATVRQDLQRLPSTVPVLLGCQALANKLAISPKVDNTHHKWSLEWEGRKFTVSRNAMNGQEHSNLLRSCAYPIPRQHGSSSSRSHRDRDRDRIATSTSWISSHSDVLYLDRESWSSGSRSVKHHRWQFITVGFVPNSAAQTTYEVHTKKKWTLKTEEISIFFEVDLQSGLPMPSTTSSQPVGFVHAMLPTKLRLPCPLHLQGSWLLSVDRQDVQSLVENDWNVELLAQFPRLCVVLLQWIAQACSSTKLQEPKIEPKLSLAYQVLPLFEITPGTSHLHSRVLDQNIPMAEVSRAVSSENVVPARIPSKNQSTSALPSLRSDLTFLPADKVIWLPKPFLSLLPVEFLTGWWGGKAPFASVITGDSAYQPLWKASVPCPTVDNLKSAKRNFARSLISLCSEGRPFGDSAGKEKDNTAQMLSREGTKVFLCVRVMAALGECLSTSVPTKYVGRLEGNKDDAHEKNKSTNVSSNKQGRCMDDSSGLLGDYLPSLSCWPVFPTDQTWNGNKDWAPSMVAPEEMVFLHPEFSSSLPSVIYDMLRPAVLKVFAGSDKSDERHHKNNSHNSGKWKNRGQPISRKETLPSYYLLDHDVEKTLTLGNDSSGVARMMAAGLDRSTIDKANQCLLHLKEHVMPHRVVGVDAACHALLSSWARQRNGHIDHAQLNQIYDLFDWAYDQKRPLAISHFIVNTYTDTRGERESRTVSGVKLVPVSEAYIDSNTSAAALLAGKFALPDTPHDSSSDLPYISYSYLCRSDKPASAARITDRGLKKFHDFLSKCGAQQGISLVAFKKKLSTSEISTYLEGNLPKLRSSNTSGDLHLPFNLGPITRKRVEVLDVDLADEWIKIVSSAKSSITNARSISALIATLLGSADTADTVTGQTTPYLSNLLSGKGLTDAPLNVQASGKNMSITKSKESTTATPADHRLSQDVELCPPPATARMLFLPPGQPGASAVNLDIATWVNRLAKEAWVPARPPGALEGDPPSLVLRPCQVVLPLQSRGLSSNNGRSSTLQSSSERAAIDAAGMPTAAVSPSILSLLLNLPPKIQAVMKWGTVQPPPPVDQLEALATNFSVGLDDERRPDGNGYGSCVYCTREEYSDILNVWRGLCIAQRENRLSSQDKKRISIALTRPKKDTKVYLIPGIVEGTLHCLDRCRYAGMYRQPGCDSLDDELLVNALCKVGFLFDVNSPSTSKQTNGSGIVWPLENLSRDLNDILNLKSVASSSDCISFVNHYYKRIYDTDGNYTAPTITEKLALSTSMWCICKSKLPKPLLATSTTDLPISLKADIFKFLTYSLPHMYVHCVNGPGIGPDAFSARWVPLWKKVDKKNIKTADVTPVLLDDVIHPPQGCRVYRSSLLRPDHKMQPLGLFDHSLRDHHKHSGDSLSKEELQRLSHIDTVLLNVLSIPRITDKTYFALGTQLKGEKEPLDGASTRLAVVFLLLNELNSIADTNSRHGAAAIQQKLALIPPMYKYDSLLLNFKYPVYDCGTHSGSATAKFPAYAIRGAKELVSSTIVGNTTGSDPSSPEQQSLQSIIISGAPVDYISELEEIMLSHLYGHPPILGARSRKALSLLSHIEDDAQFLKYLSRHFPEFLANDGSDNNNQGEAACSSKESQNSFDENGDEDSSARAIKWKSELLKSIDILKNKIKEKEASKKNKRRKVIDDSEVAPSIYEPMKSRMESSAPLDVIPVMSKGESADVCGNGRGRGISNKPAWMTSSEPLTVAVEVPSSPPTTSPLGRGLSFSSASSISANLDLLVTDPSKLSPRAGLAGRGRGVVNTPAWLASASPSISEMQVTEDYVENSKQLVSVENGQGLKRLLEEGEEEENVEETNKAKAVILEDNGVQEESYSTKRQKTDGIDSVSSRGLADDFLSKLASSTSVSATATTSESDAPPVVGRGRGRGLTNLPAWMTQDATSESGTVPSTIASQGMKDSIRSELTFPVMANILSLLVNRPRVTNVSPDTNTSRNDKTITDFTTAVAYILTDSVDNREKMRELCTPTALQHLLDHYKDNLNLSLLDSDRARHIQEKLDSVVQYVTAADSTSDLRH